MNRSDEDDVLQALVETEDPQVIRNAFFPSFVNLLDNLSQGKEEGKFDYRITVISYCRKPEHYPLTVKILQKLFNETVVSGIFDKENNILVWDEEEQIKFAIPKEEAHEFLKSHKLVVLRGNYELWEDSGFNSEGGKPFHVAENAYFIDDKLFRKMADGSLEKIIVHPMNSEGVSIPFEEVSSRCLLADTKKAEESKDYYIDFLIQNTSEPIARDFWESVKSE